MWDHRLQKDKERLPKFLCIRIRFIFLRSRSDRLRIAFTGDEAEAGAEFRRLRFNPGWKLTTAASRRGTCLTAFLPLFLVGFRRLAQCGLVSSFLPFPLPLLAGF